MQVWRVTFCNEFLDAKKKKKKKRRNQLLLPLKCAPPCHQAEVSVCCSAYPASRCHDPRIGLRTLGRTRPTERERERELSPLTVNPTCVTVVRLPACVRRPLRKPEPCRSVFTLLYGCFLFYFRGVSHRGVCACVCASAGEQLCFTSHRQQRVSAPGPDFPPLSGDSLHCGANSSH